MQALNFHLRIHCALSHVKPSREPAVIGTLDAGDPCKCP